MASMRVEGLNSIYLDEELESFSSIAAGHIIRALGHGLKVAYVDSSKKSSKLINFFENLSLSSSFVKSFDRIYIETYTFRDENKIAKGIIPSVEFFSIDKQLFWKSLEKVDVVIFDNLNLEMVPFFSLSNFLRNRNPETEVISFVNNKKDYDKLKEEFNYGYIVEKNKERSLVQNKNVIALTGEGKGKSLLSFGHLIREFINKNDVKLVYFDKGDQFYGEMKFFNSLKEWKKTHKNYGTFDYVATGIPRRGREGIRTNNTPADIKEAQEGLMLLQTALKKQTPVVADELSETIEKKLLSIDEVVEVLENVRNELIITGEHIQKEIKSLCHQIITLHIDKKPKKEKGLKKGIDF